MNAVLCFVTIVTIVATARGQDIQFGQKIFPAGEGAYVCEHVPYQKTFSTADIHVFITLYNADVKGNTYEAAVGWVENVTATAFQACAETSGPYRDLKTLRVNWMAYETTPDGSQSGRHTFSIFTSGTRCERVDFPTNFPGMPDVYTTPVHLTTGRRSDAATIWVEDIKAHSFHACLRELKNFNGAHDAVQVDWMALRIKPGGGKAKEMKRMKMLNEGSPKKGRKYSFCQNTSFESTFFEPPVIITTATHEFDKNNPRSVDPTTNSISNWLEKMTNKGFELCMKDGQQLSKKHTQVDIQYMAIGDLDPCIPVICGFYAQCVAFGPSDARCVCDYTCPDYQDMVCSTAGVTYNNTCQYRKAMCETKQNIPIMHPGMCRPFILQRGRTEVTLDTVDVQCREVLVNANLWYSSLPVFVLITVNYDSEATNVVHDAITTWVEKISHAKFTTCALKSGRNEYEGVVPTNYGATFIDWIAFQGSPLGGVVGEEVMSDWWEGTECKQMSLPVGKFASSPSILLTAEHTRIDLKHDAATLWTEDVTLGTFKVCLRELQNFDGAHRDIRVNWIAYEDLPRNLFSEHETLLFANTQAPLESDLHAYCKTVEFRMNYQSAPTILVSATHNSTRSGALKPKYNSIASWIENVDARGFRVCMKEFHDEASYDPVAVSWTALPECSFALGVADVNVIPDAAMTASSILPGSEYAGAAQARLNLQPVSGTSMGAWCANGISGQWLEVDLGHLHIVSGVATQGGGRVNNKWFQHWVTSYKLSHSKDGIAFTDYKENTITRVFTGNNDGTTSVRNTFQDPVEMRYLRFLPQATNGAELCMRVELYGCDTEPLHVRILSEGCEDNPSRCGFSSIEVDGIERSMKGRGHNVVALDQNGYYVAARVFDTFGHPFSGDEMKTFIASLPINTIVLISVQESGNLYIDSAKSALSGIYTDEPLTPGWRESWALVGFKGISKPSWIRQAWNQRGKGPTVIATSIPLYGK